MNKEKKRTAMKDSMIVSMISMLIGTKLGILFMISSNGYSEVKNI